MKNFVRFEIFSTPYCDHPEIKIYPTSFYIASAVGNEIRPGKKGRNWSWLAYGDKQLDFCLITPVSLNICVVMIFSKL